jgi:hypothetical protein
MIILHGFLNCISHIVLNGRITVSTVGKDFEGNIYGSSDFLTGLRGGTSFRVADFTTNFKPR